MRVEGFDSSEVKINKLSPLLFEHINFFGKYLQLLMITIKSNAN